MKYLRSIAEKTDLGRLAGPSVIRLVDDAMSLTESQSIVSSNTSAKIWDTVEEMLLVTDELVFIIASVRADNFLYNEVAKVHFVQLLVSDTGDQHATVTFRSKMIRHNPL